MVLADARSSVVVRAICEPGREEPQRVLVPTPSLDAAGVIRMRAIGDEIVVQVVQLDVAARDEQRRM